MENNENQIILNIHYYLQNNSHSMDMSIRNKMDKHIFNILQEISSACEIQIQLETLAYEEGGLMEKIIITCVDKAVTGLGQLIMYFLSGEHKRNKLKTKIMEVQLEKSIIEKDIAKNHLDMSNLAKENLEKNTKLNKNLSSYYKAAKEYPKIEQIGYKTDYTQNEKIVFRDKFEDFILKNQEVVETEKEVKIEIISPILQNKTRYKWKGIYNNQIIDFTMSDKEFKKGIENKKYNFLNGTTIVCDLIITTKYDNEGLPSSNPIYKVDNVLETTINEGNRIITKQTEKGRKKQIDDSENLFKGLM